MVKIILYIVKTGNYDDGYLRAVLESHSKHITFLHAEFKHKAHVCIFYSDHKRRVMIDELGVDVGLDLVRWR